jgi:hypothetical protein
VIRDQNAKKARLKLNKYIALNIYMISSSYETSGFCSPEYKSSLDKMLNRLPELLYIIEHSANFESIH